MMVLYVYIFILPTISFSGSLPIFAYLPSRAGPMARPVTLLVEPTPAVVSFNTAINYYKPSHARPATKAPQRSLLPPADRRSSGIRLKNPALTIEWTDLYEHQAMVVTTRSGRPKTATTPTTPTIPNTPTTPTPASRPKSGLRGGISPVKQKSKDSSWTPGLEGTSTPTGRKLGVSEADGKARGTGGKAGLTHVNTLKSLYG